MALTKVDPDVIDITKTSIALIGDHVSGGIRQYIDSIQSSQAGTGGLIAGAGDITLTAASPAALFISPTGFGNYVTLPDATTCISKGILYNIFNNSDYDYGIRDSAGNKLGWVLPHSGAVVGLCDNSTATGVWTIPNLSHIGTTANRTISGFNNFNISGGPYCTTIIQVDSSRLLFLLLTTTSLYAVVYNSTTYTWGNAVKVVDNVDYGTGILSNTDQILLAAHTTSNAIVSLTLTLTGNTITANSGTQTSVPAAGALTGAPTVEACKLIAVGTSWVLGYHSGDHYIRALTITGTTVAIGAERRITYTSVLTPVKMFVSGNVVRVVSGTDTNIYITPFTVTGSTLTIGTGTTTPVNNPTYSINSFSTFQNGYGNIVIVAPAVPIVAIISKLTATTEVSSTLALDSNTEIASSCVLPVSNNKTLVCWGVGSSTHLNIITDTSGVASIGTMLISPTSTYAGTLKAIRTDGTKATYLVDGAYSAVSAAVQVDCNTNSPVIVNVTKASEVYPLPLSNLIHSNSGSFQLNTLPGFVCGSSYLKSIADTKPTTYPLVFNNISWHFYAFDSNTILITNFEVA